MKARSRSPLELDLSALIRKPETSRPGSRLATALGALLIVAVGAVLLLVLLVLLLGRGEGHFSSGARPLVPMRGELG